jgi:hypothetical protein
VALRAQSDSAEGCGATSQAILAPYRKSKNPAAVRQGAISALAGGWPGDALAKQAWLLVLIGAPEAGVAPAKQAIPPDEGGEVRDTAVWCLGRQWKGDAQAKEALLRVLIGVPDAGKTPAEQTVPPDSHWWVRQDATRSLEVGWESDAQVKTALERVATGTSADGSLIEKEKIIRDTAKQALDNWLK